MNRSQRQGKYPISATSDPLAGSCLFFALVMVPGGIFLCVDAYLSSDVRSLSLACLVMILGVLMMIHHYRCRQRTECMALEIRIVQCEQLLQEAVTGPNSQQPQSAAAPHQPSADG
jgi:uncharacterized membrane protein HdeD (DUF308 family)